jgi:hypothetical protein
MSTLFMNGMEAATHHLWHNNAHFSKARTLSFLFLSFSFR